MVYPEGLFHLLVVYFNELVADDAILTGYFMFLQMMLILIYSFLKQIRLF